MKIKKLNRVELIVKLVQGLMLSASMVLMIASYHLWTHRCLLDIHAGDLLKIKGEGTFYAVSLEDVKIYADQNRENKSVKIDALDWTRFDNFEFKSEKALDFKGREVWRTVGVPIPHTNQFRSTDFDFFYNGRPTYDVEVVGNVEKGRAY